MAAPTDSVEISALTAGAALDGTEILPMVQAGATVRNPLSAALTYFNANASLAAARITSGTLLPSRGGTGVSNADANTLTLGGATSITGGGTLALAGFTLTVPATGIAALLATANVFTATQTVKDSNNALGITLAGANAGGTPAIAVTAPTQAASATAGTPLSITASAAVAGSSNAGAAAGGNVTITAGAAARLTSGNANGGNINLTPGAGIGTGTSGQILIPDGTLAVPSLAFASEPGSGIYRVGAFQYTLAINGLQIAALQSDRIIVGNNIFRTSGSSNVGTLFVGAGVNDTALARNASAVAEINNGNSGQWGSLKAGVRDAGTATITDGLTLGHQSTGTPAAGLGTAIQLNINSSTTADQNAVRLTAEWVVATHASRTARYKLNVYDTASREVLRGEASGSAPMIGFLGSAAQLQQASGANLTNNVTSGGTDDTIANFTDLTIYANDSAAIRNDIYQLARKLKQVNDALRLYGLLT